MEHLYVKKEVNDLVLLGWDWIKYHNDISQFKLMQDALNYMEEQDISFSFTSNGEERGDIREYRYDSKKNPESVVPIPEVYCAFNDEQAFKEMENWNKEVENEME